MLIFSGIAIVLGVLLTLSALLGARVGRASARADGWPGGVRRFLLSPIDPATWESAWAIGQGFFVGTIGFSLVVSIFSTGASLLVVGIGVVLVGVGVEVSRVIAGIERGRVSVTGTAPLLAHGYRPRGQGARDLAMAVFLDLNRWRDVAYVLISFPLTVIEFGVTITLWAATLLLLSMPAWIGDVGGAAAISVGSGPVTGPLADWVVILAFSAGVVLLFVASSVTQALLALHRAVVAGLLCESEQRALHRRVATLEGSRRAVLDVEASELRRIERDLHDGAQQRLVMLAMSLGMAAEKIDDDPARAKAMVLEAREQARQALAELRDLARGIAPSILMDRGLVPALESIAGRTPVPTSVLSTVPVGIRLPDAIERAAYFVVAESLANVAKHAAGAAGADAALAPGQAATRCEVRCRPDGPNLVVEVWDDGAGGATLVPGGGLAGLRDRVEGVDGTLTVESPVGGPTLIRATIPVAGRVTHAAPTPPPAPTGDGWVR